MLRRGFNPRTQAGPGKFPLLSKITAPVNPGTLTLMPDFDNFLTGRGRLLIIPMGREGAFWRCNEERKHHCGSSGNL